MEQANILQGLTNYKRNKVYMLYKYFMTFSEGVDSSL